MSDLNRRALLGGGLALAGSGVAALAGAAPSSAATPSKYAREYYKYFKLGPRAIPLSDTVWTPQGLTSWGNDKLIISYYDGRQHKPNDPRWSAWLKKHGPDKSRLVIVHRDTLRPIKTLILNTTGHVGGLAMAGGYLWVAQDGVLWCYPASRLNAASGTLIHATRSADVASKCSYAFAEGANVWVGSFNEKHRDTMYRYSVSGGKLTRREELPTPSKVQGVAVVGNRIIWSTSYGNVDSRFVVWPRRTKYNGDPDIGNWITAPPRSEGIAYANGHLHVVYESSSKVFDTTPHRIRSIHHGVVPSLNG